MKRIFLFIILVGIVFASFSDSLSNVWLRAIYAQEASNSPEQQQMFLAATVQIVMFGQATANQTTVSAARGLGTLVHHGTQTLIVTHDHWGDVMANTDQVEFRDAHYGLLLTLDGTRFRHLISYRDEGTMILTAPAELPLDQATFLNQGVVQPGNVVTVARRHQEPDGRIIIETMPATITAVEQRQERPIYILRSLDGQAIVHGDSGGGVWWNGRLIGNTWGTEMLTGWRLGNWSINADATTTDISITAQFPQLSPQGEAVADLLETN
jgi:hypothetical protein